VLFQDDLLAPQNLYKQSFTWFLSRWSCSGRYPFLQAAVIKHKRSFLLNAQWSKFGLFCTLEVPYHDAILQLTVFNANSFTYSESLSACALDRRVRKL